ncbi:unnamed protein product [Arctogadus glacialis]
MATWLPLHPQPAAMPCSLGSQPPWSSWFYRRGPGRSGWGLSLPGPPGSTGGARGGQPGVSASLVLLVLQERPGEVSLGSQPPWSSWFYRRGPGRSAWGLSLPGPPGSTGEARGGQAGVSASLVLLVLQERPGEVSLGSQPPWSSWFYRRGPGRSAWGLSLPGPPGSTGEARGGQPGVSASLVLLVLQERPGEVRLGSQPPWSSWFYRRGPGRSAWGLSLPGPPGSTGEARGGQPGVSASLVLLVLQERPGEVRLGSQPPWSSWFYRRGPGRSAWGLSLPGPPGSTGEARGGQPGVSASLVLLVLQERPGEVSLGSQPPWSSWFYRRGPGRSAWGLSLPGPPGSTGEARGGQAGVSASLVLLVLQERPGEVSLGSQPPWSSWFYRRGPGRSAWGLSLPGPPGSTGEARGGQPGVSASLVLLVLQERAKAREVRL